MWQKTELCCSSWGLFFLSYQLRRLHRVNSHWPWDITSLGSDLTADRQEIRNKLLQDKRKMLGSLYIKQTNLYAWSNPYCCVVSEILPITSSAYIICPWFVIESHYVPWLPGFQGWDRTWIFCLTVFNLAAKDVGLYVTSQDRLPLCHTRGVSWWMLRHNIIRRDRG